LGHRIFQHRPATHRLADQTNVLQFQVIDQGREVAGIVGRVDAAGDGF